MTTAVKDSVKELMKKLFSEGKSSEDVASELAKLDECKNLQADEIAVRVLAFKKAEAASASVRVAEAEESKLAEKKASDDATEKKIGDLVAEKLKSINIDPSRKYGGLTMEKSWDYAKGEFVTEDQVNSEGKKAMNAMISALAQDDRSSAKSISDEIRSDNSRYGIKATMRSDSDAVGGYAIPTEVADEINQLTYQESVMLKHVNRNGIVVEDKIYPTFTDISVAYIANQDTAATESNPTVSNPTVNMERFGAFTNISNTLIRQKGANLTSAFTTGYASARARFIDTELTIGNITGNSDLIDGLTWQGTALTAVARSTFGVSDLVNVVTNMDNEYNPATTFWVCNHQVKSTIGLLESTGGNREYPEYITGNEFKPLGFPVIENNKITSVLDVGGDDSTGGTDDVLLLVDLSKFIVGLAPQMEIATSVDFNFTKDQMTMRGLDRIGFKLLFADLCQVQELTN